MTQIYSTARDNIGIDDIAAKLKAQAETADPTDVVSHSLAAAMFPAAAKLLQAHGESTPPSDLINAVIVAGVNVTFSLLGSTLLNVAKAYELNAAQLREGLDAAFETFAAVANQRQPNVVTEIVKLHLELRARGD